MQRISVIFAVLAMLALSLPASAQQTVTLNVITAGDQNMVDYVKDYLGPMFEKEHAGVTVRAVGTGPGDAGSQKIYEKLEAEKGNPTWDIDVAVIHQKAAGEMVGKACSPAIRPRSRPASS
jgi:spermidine/putrescine-binding protein